MAAVEQVAAAHYRRQVALSRRSAVEAGRLWSQVDRSDIARSWLSLLVRLLTVVSSAQAIAAASSATYLDDALEVQGIDPTADGRLRPGAFAGVASDGRDLETLLYQPAIRTLDLIGQGAVPARALAAGRVALDMMVRTQIADAGRVADGVALTARRGAPGYVRMLSPPSCARCVILAGKFYRWNRGFARHPRCDCRHIPAAESNADDLRVRPTAYFESLSPTEQDRVFGKAGAQAIRDGARLSLVVNARRGMYTASIGSVRFAATREATTVRGLYGGYEIQDNGTLRKRGADELTRVRSGNRFIRAARAPRLMPEQIYTEAKGDRDEAIRLLKRFGYLI